MLVARSRSVREELPPKLPPNYSQLGGNSRHEQGRPNRFAQSNQACATLLGMGGDVSSGLQNRCSTTELTRQTLIYEHVRRVGVVGDHENECGGDWCSQSCDPNPE